ncbi:hypothetical protein ACIP93_07805 [Streptomyces sp. NPDC088745]|uniref:hypothetical protein n=1 Tax=Streptomyces sp. NPDC088745 TaxID=3365884 RepID=UPI0037FD31A7
MPPAPPSTRPQFDPLVVSPPLARARHLTGARDWPGLVRYFAALDHPDEEAAACRTVGGTHGSETFLRQVADLYPADPLPRVLLADRLISLGWEIRSGARAQHVTAAQFEQFHAHLRQAEQLLIAVCAQYPAYALAWYLRGITARGLELGQSEARRRYDRLAAHHPHHYPAQRQLLQQSCPKWGGSWEAAHGFAEACARAAPPGSQSPAVVAEAHFEHWSDLDGAEATGYLRRPDVRDSLLNAAAASVLHPSFRPGFHGVTAHTYFAFAHSVAGRHAEAAPHFRALGNCADEHPWLFLPGRDAAAAFSKHRASALGRG